MILIDQNHTESKNRKNLYPSIAEFKDVPVKCALYDARAVRTAPPTTER
jgi:hypothetical protein